MKHSTKLLAAALIALGLNQAAWADGVPDFRETLQAAERGNAQAQFNLGVMYATGQGVHQDYTEAVRWYRKAADQGYAEAQNNLGSMYYAGSGVHQDYAEAVRWYRKAAEQGNAGGQYYLGWMYDDGRGVRQDYAEAVRWFRRAAEQEHDTGCAQAFCGLVRQQGEIPTVGQNSRHEMQGDKIRFSDGMKS